MRIAHKRGDDKPTAKRRSPLKEKEEAFKRLFIASHNRKIQAAKRKSIKELNNTKKN